MYSVDRNSLTSGHLGCMQIGIPSLGRMPTIREPDSGGSMPLMAIIDDEGQMTGITCPLNVGVDPHDIEGCEDLLESYFMQVCTFVTL